MKDWVGNTNSVFKGLGASNHCSEERQNEDYYATSPIAVEKLLEKETFSHKVLEPFCGEGHISKVLEAHGYDVKSTDLIDRGFGGGGYDFLELNYNNRDLISNPPYRISSECVEHALDISEDGVKVAMLLKIQFLEGKKRRQLFEKYPPKYVYVFSERIECGKNGVFTGGSAVAYCWFIWEKGEKSEPIIRWL